MKDVAPFIESMLRQGGRLVLSRYGAVHAVQQKIDPAQVVTAVDIACEKLIIASISEKFTRHSTLGEESGFVDNQSEYVWVIDPIDGTSNFANGLPWFGIMIGLLKDYRPIAGGIYLPVTDELYLAEAGKGAYRNGSRYYVKREDSLQKSLIALHVDPTDDPKELAELSTLFSNLLRRVRNLRTTNSAVDYAYMTEGKIGGLINFKNKIWDDAAVAIIAKEAGNLFTDHQGEDVDFTFTHANYLRDFSFVSAAPEIHKQLLPILQIEQS